MSVLLNFKQIHDTINRACEKVNRNPDEITIIGVTKYVTIERTEEVIGAGIENIGENRTEELIDKFSHIGNRVNWHFIGTLQSRKVKDIINKVTAIHSVDRLSLARQISNRADSPIDCFVQVNVAGEESKHGLSTKEVIPFIEKLSTYKNIRIVGLMTMAPHIADDQKLRAVFKKMATLRDTVKGKGLIHAPCNYLSMGMSNDYEIAIEEGATHIRIGSKLVGSE